MGGLGSIPSGLLVAAAFVVLIVIRYAVSGQGTKIPETGENKERKVMRMRIRTWLTASLETTWAVATEMLAGLPLLT